MGKITINGKTYSADITAGSLLRFKRELGYDFLREPERLDTEGLITLAWASVKSTAAVNGEKFDETIESMADKMQLSELNALGEWVSEETRTKGDEEGDEEDDSKKKKP